MDFEDQSFHSPYPNPLNDFTSNRNTVEPHYRGSVATDVSRCRDYSSDEFDTDLEIEGNEKKSNDRDKRDDLAPPVDIYLSTCAMYSTPPQTSVTKDLQRREISVRHRSLSAKDLASIAVALAKSGVERVDLRGNDLRGEGVTFIQTAVALNQNITYLDLSENNLGSSFEGAVTVGEMLRYNKTLTELHLSGNHFKDADSVYLAAGIAVNSRLETLDLSRNNFEEDGGMHVGRAIGKNCTIIRLDLSWNSIRRRGAVALCRGLQENTGIREIDLAHNGFGYEGALAVGELLSKNTQLQRLDLSSNQINWNGAMFVAKGLAKNKTLEVLRLNSNQLTTTGCMDLIEAVSGSSSLLRILTLKNVPVIEKFESVAKEIQHKRAFYFEHGGIVPSHDVLGQRPEKQLKPMQKVINHMKSREYRPLEMFRLLDLNVDRQLTREDLLDRMKKIGVADLHKHELEALFEILQSSSSQTANKEPENVVYKLAKPCKSSSFVMRTAMSCNRIILHRRLCRRIAQKRCRCDGFHTGLYLAS